MRGGALPRARVLFQPAAHAAGRPATGPGPGAAQLAGWKLTLPTVGKNGNAAMVNPARVSPPWLTTDAGGNLVFWAPVGGATTAHSEHARTELDSLQDFPAGAGPQGSPRRCRWGRSRAGASM